jgi:hypothetical protein
MKASLLTLRLCVCAAVALGAVGLGAACLVGPEQVLGENEPFDGAFLDACSDGSTMSIPAADCPLCSGKTATAVCVGGYYSFCSCTSSIPSCDSGCCAAPGYAVMYCKGKGNVVTPYPSEGLCPTPNGYLVCNGECFSTFSCTIPEGYTLEDAGRDAAPDGSHPKDGGKRDAADRDAADGSPDANDTGAGDSSADAPPADAAPG